MKLNDFKKIKDNYYKKSVVVVTHKGQKIIGKYDSEFRELPIIFIGNEEVYIKDIQKIDFLNDSQIYKYVSVCYDDDYSGKAYSYKTTISGIQVGDVVVVDRNGNEAYGTVESIELYTRDTAPYPVEKTKDIIKVIPIKNDLDYNYYDNDDEDIEQDYLNVLLQAMFGKISIKRLMKLICPLNDDLLEFDLYYYPKFNTFFYEIEDNKYKLAEYNTGLITQEMFKIMVTDSILVPKKEFISDAETYKTAREFCEDNKIPYHDDTDILDYSDIKKELKKDTPIKEDKSFKSLDEIKKYLTNYQSAKWETPTPSYYIENNRIIHYEGWLDYDYKIFEAFKYIINNKLIDEQYYNRKSYPDFFEEDWNDYDIETLDYPRLCYLLFRIYNIERMSEGIINKFASNGKLLKMIERLETVDKNEKSNKKYKKVQVEIPKFLLNKNKSDNH